MTWCVEFLEEAKKDMKKLERSASLQVLKGIQKVSQNPLPVQEGGYGKPLGNKNGANLTNLLKIKFRDLGIRVVYKVERMFPQEQMNKCIEKLLNEEKNMNCKKS